MPVGPEPVIAPYPTRSMERSQARRESVTGRFSLDRAAALVLSTSQVVPPYMTSASGTDQLGEHPEGSSVGEEGGV